jgi:outer membrane murein-binding lipoprotein Lpp
MKRIPLFVFLFLAIVLAGCAQDPRKDAQANEINTQAAQDAATAEQQRQFAADRHAYEMADAARWRMIKDSAIETAKRVMNFTVWIAGIAIAISISGLAGSIAFSLHKIGMAAATGADIKARLIYLDKNTGQFPMFVYEGHGRGHLLNGNTNGALPLDTRHEPDRQMIANSGAVLIASMVAREAARSEDPAGVSIVRPETIDVTPEMIALHKELMRNDE